MDILLVLTVGTISIVSFFIGAKVGQKVANGEPIETPNLNPMDAIRRERSKREAEREMNRIETILHNIDNYDGTSAGQKDVPK